MIFEFDETENLVMLKENIRKTDQMRVSLSINTENHRKFYRELDINFSEAKEVIKKSEFAILIECYTFSERLLKNTIYHCLNYTRSSNQHINAFMKKKIEPDKFSPNVKFNEFEKELKTLANSNQYKFLLEKNNIKVRMYDEMVTSRHRYAHSNKYPMDYENYEEIVLILEYLSWECNLFINHLDSRIEMSNEHKVILEEIKQLKKMHPSVQKLRGQPRDRTKSINIIEFRKRVTSYLKKYKNKLIEVTIFEDRINILQEIETLNFNVNTINDLRGLCGRYLREQE